MTDPIYIENQGDGHWISTDGAIEIIRDDTFQTECDAPHPVRLSLDKMGFYSEWYRQELMRRGTVRGKNLCYFCEGGEEHFYTQWTVKSDGEWTEDVYDTFTQAVRAVEAATGRKVTRRRKTTENLTHTAESARTRESTESSPEGGHEMETETLTFEQQIDTAIAAAYVEIERIDQRLSMYREQICYQAGFQKRYESRSRWVWTRSRSDYTLVVFKDALETVREMLATVEPDTYFSPLSRGGTVKQAQDSIDNYDALVVEHEQAVASYKSLSEQYRGWSRFFLVTSSKGHIHSSMSCHSCRPTTGYGWMPMLSGKTEADAVAEIGPALCTHCFPSAPVEWTQAEISKADANRRAATA